MKRPAVTDSVSDIFELDDSQPMTSGGQLTSNGANGLGVGGRPVGAPGNVHQAQAQHHEERAQARVLELQVAEHDGARGSGIC